MSQDPYLSRKEVSESDQPSSHPSRFQKVLTGVALAGFATAVLAYSTRAVKQDDFSDVPPLPPINDDAIRIQVFTHRSFYARPGHVFEDHPDDPSPDNEKFEHLGDTVLGLIITNLLFDTYPNLRVGPSTEIRALLVSNATLADISCRYQLPARLKLHPAQAVTLMASKNIQADVFESYVGGLYLDQGLSTVEKWLKLLFKPYVTEAYIRVRTQHEGSGKSNGQTSTPAHRNSHHHPHA